MDEAGIIDECKLVLKFLKDRPLDPQERSVVLKSSAAILDNMIASEALMQMWNNSLRPIR